MTSPKLGLRKKILFSIIMLSIPFLFLELLARAYFATKIGPRIFLYGTMFSRHQVSFDPKGVAQRKAQEDATVSFHDNVKHNYTKYYPHQTLVDRDEFGNRINVRINSRGFRGKDFALAKQAKIIRIVTLGASSTFGFHDHDDQTYPYYMEQMLNEALPSVNAQLRGSSSNTIEAFEVINLGIPHLTSQQIYSLLVNEGLELDPDFVTFYEGINDTVWRESSDALTNKTKQSIKAIPLANEVFREMRYRLLSAALIGMAITTDKGEFSDADVEAFSLEKKANFIANLQRIYEACKLNSSTLIVASQQATTLETQREKLRGMTYDEEQANVRKKLTTTHRSLPIETSFLVHKDLMDEQRKWAITNSVPYVDVIQAMDLNRQNLVTWVHLNSAGNRIVASALANEILKLMVNKKVSTARKP